MTIYDIIANGAKVVLLACEEQKAIYTWNQQLTFQKWTEADTSYCMSDREELTLTKVWDERNAHTLFEKPESLEAAQQKVRELWEEDFQ